MNRATYTTKSGAVITAELDGDTVTLSQDGHHAGTGTLSPEGRIEDCAARLGAADGSETEAAYAALETALAAQLWLDVAIAPERRPESLTAREVAEADQALVAAGGDAALLTAAGGEEAVARWYNAR